MKIRSFSATAVACLTGAALAAGLLGACADSATPDEPGRKMEISVSPLTLPNVLDACYTLEVHNDAGALVWSQEHVCSSQFGNGLGAITYIGPCDATDNDETAGTHNTVTLALENLYTQTADPADLTAGAIADDEWDNPCGGYFDGSPVDPDSDDVAGPNADGHGPCQLVYECLENEDVLVEFNLTIMRDANQGFFDIAVNFEDIFCSSKVDCTYDEAGADPIELLHNPGAGNGRDQTVVVGRACTAGADATATFLHVSQTAIVCGHNGETAPIEGATLVEYLSILAALGSGGNTQLVVQFDPASGDGNQDQDNLTVWGPGTGGTLEVLDPAPDVSAVFFQNANYSGTEALTDELGNSYNKVYLNEAIGFDYSQIVALQQELGGCNDDGSGAPCWNWCTLVAQFTASDAGIPADATVYPSIIQLVPLWTSDAGLVCTQHALDSDDGQGVQTFYLAPAQITGLGMISADICMESAGLGEPLQTCSGP